jgi:hypothetical protein
MSTHIVLDNTYVFISANPSLLAYPATQTGGCLHWGGRLCGVSDRRQFAMLETDHDPLRSDCLEVGAPYFQCRIRLNTHLSVVSPDISLLRQFPERPVVLQILGD